MSSGLADTSVLVARELGRRTDMSVVPTDLAVSVITLGELRAGVLVARDTATRDLRLATLTAALQLDPLSVNEMVAAAWARLRVQLRDLGRRMPINDSWIAATAMAYGLAVITQDADYDVGVPDLQVIRV